MKKIICVMIALVMLIMSCAALAEPAAAEPGVTLETLTARGAKVSEHDGRVTFVEGACTEEKVLSMEDAEKVVHSMLTLMGGNEKTQFEPWRKLTDAGGNIYYVFQQVYAQTTVSGGAVKIVTDPEGQMLGLVASVESELPETEEAEGIAQARAEEIVREHLDQEGHDKAELLAGRSEVIILPVNLVLDMDSQEEKEESRYVWAVYSENPESNMVTGSELPYLAHYVTMDGEYLYNLPTLLPGDEVSTSGYAAAYVFDFMEPVDYTTSMTLPNGETREITVTLMRDSRTGMYYMGNVERRIAVADCWEFLYNTGSVVLESSRENAGWDENCLLALYNYCKAWDYYEEIGWHGADGEGTPILILKDYCNREHEPIDNAAYAGKYYGWQVFLSSSANDFAGCLDILAHEFTHCVTHSVMTYNAYKNDFGAINEAMSDIQGNICETMKESGEDEWLLGEDSEAKAFRSMSSPHAHKQPEYVWDLYYVGNVKEPTTVNDRGGVHNNSSLLNNIGYRLCEKGGMTLEEARAFWFAVDCSMVPGTDYPQLSELLPWVLKITGMEKYETALEAALDATRIRSNDLPTAFDSDRALVTLELPDQESFSDGNWMLFIVTADMEEIVRRLGQLSVEDTDQDALVDMLKASIADLVYSGTGAAGQDGRTIRMVTLPGRTLPVLFRFEVDEEMHVTSLGLAVYVLGKWRDIGTKLAPLMEKLSDLPMPQLQEGTAEPEETETPATTEAPDLSWLEDLFAGDEKGEDTTLPAIEIPEWLLNALDAGKELVKELLLYQVRGGEVNAIPSDGLDQVEVLDAEKYSMILQKFSVPQTQEPAEGTPAEDLPAA